MAIMVMVVITEAITSGRLDVWLAKSDVLEARRMTRLGQRRSLPAAAGASQPKLLARSILFMVTAEIAAIDDGVVVRSNGCGAAHACEVLHTRTP
jgi:hypothetical protein